MWRTSSLQSRGAAAARAGSVDLLAPVHASAGVDLPCSPDAVWCVLADIESWPGTLPGITKARLLSRPAHARHPGDRFEWVNSGTPIRSRIEVASPGHELTWTGVALWLVAVHRNTVDPLAGGCRLTGKESMAGLGARWLMPAGKLQAQLEAFVHAIGDEAARREG